MVRFLSGLVLLGLVWTATADRSRAAMPEDILIHLNALLCRDVKSLKAGISAWQAGDEEAFQASLKSGDCFLPQSTAKGTLLAVDDGRANIVVEYFLIQALALQAPQGTPLWAMVGTYSRWPENWNRQ